MWRSFTVIEPSLFDPDIDAENKVKKINAALAKRNMDPLTREELERVYGFEAANKVFGPEGEYQRRLDVEADERKEAKEEKAKFK